MIDTPDAYTVVTAPHEGRVRQRIFKNGLCVHTNDISWKTAMHKGQALIDQAMTALRSAEKKAPE